MEPIIQLRDVDKVYRIGQQDFYALKDVSLTFGAGEFAGLVGPSGSGKTTLLNLIGGLDRATRGSIEVMGHELIGLSNAQAADLRNRHIGFIFQSYHLFPVYTVFENVEFPLVLLKMPAAQRRKKVLEALDWVGLADRRNQKPDALSGGQCQRVAIARAMVKNPGVVLADEPTANLDSANSHQILETMQRLNRDLGTTFLFSTHDQKVIDYLRRVVTLVDGAVAADQGEDVVTA